MKLFVVLAFMIGAVAANSRILNGVETSVDEYPSTVQIDAMMVRPRVWNHECGGVVLNTLYILSSAQCFDGTFYHRHSRRIRAGATYRNEGGMTVYIVREFIHPDYNYRTYDNDITVVLLSSPLIMSPRIQPATFLRQGTIIPDNTPVTYLGWGHDIFDVPSPILLKGNVFTINREICNQRYNPFNRNVTENMICAGILNDNGFGPCRRDLGGPLMYGNVVVGLISWIRGCGFAQFPGVNVNVAQYTNWIVERSAF